MAIFSGNNIDLKVSIGTTGSATVSLVFGNETITEVYNALGGEITIIDFKSLANSFFNFYKSSLLDNLIRCNFRSSNTKIDVQVKVGNLILYANTVVYSQIPVGVEYSQFKQFVNRYPKVSALPVGAVACLNFYADYDITQRVYFWHNNQVEYREIPYTWKPVVNDNLVTLPVTWEDALEFVNEDGTVVMDNLKSMTLELRKADIVIDSITFTPSHHRIIKNFAFIGALGEAEVLCFRGQEVVTDEIDPTFLDINHQTRKVRTELVKSYKVNTGYLRPFEVELFDDMLESPYVCLIADDGSAIPITITECEAEETLPHVKPTAFKFTYRIADNNAQRVFTRQSAVPNKRVFTTEYTKVFS